ncbi:MAG: lipoprotein [Armatimonadota bacterium]|jgi:hypothetical protein
MVRTLRYDKRWCVAAALVVFIAVAVMLSGCGNKGSQGADVAMPTGSSAPHTSASGPAITDKVSFDQLTLESTPKAVTDKNGLVFLHFKYADYDGKVYECVLPKAMSEGEYTLSEWSSTFNAYKLPKVVAQKKVKKTEDYSDFPFISPKPQPVQPEPQEAPQAAPAPPSPADQLPAMPGFSEPGMAPLPAPADRPPSGQYTL